MKRGFALLELLLALVVISLLTGLLFTVFDQTGRAFKVVTRIVDGHTQALVASQIMIRDLAGVSVPLEYTVQKMSKVTTEPSADKKIVTDQSITEVEPLNKIFYSAVQGEHLQELTFITTNPLPTYWSSGSGSPKPRLARIMYRLSKDEKRGTQESFFTLKRQESTDLGMRSVDNSKEGARAYDLLTGITSMKLTYYALLPVPHDQQSEQTASTKVKKFTVWNVEQQGGNQELITAGVIVPFFIEIRVVVRNSRGTRDETYAWSVPILYSTSTLQNGDQLVDGEPPAAPMNKEQMSKQSPPSSSSPASEQTVQQSLPVAKSEEKSGDQSPSDKEIRTASSEHAEDEPQQHVESRKKVVHQAKKLLTARNDTMKDVTLQEEMVSENTPSQEGHTA